MIETMVILWEIVRRFEILPVQRTPVLKNVASKARCEARWDLARGAYEAVREHARGPQRGRWDAQQFFNALL